MEEQIDTAENRSESKPIVREKRSIKMRIWNIACIILFAAGLVFLIFFFDKYYRFNVFSWDLILGALIPIIIIFACFISTPRKIAAFKIVLLIIAGIVLTANWYVYFRYIPKYEPDDACAIVEADPEYASVIIKPQEYNGVPEYYRFVKGKPVITGPYLRLESIYKIEDNPFCEWGYVLDVVSDGKVTGLIGFDIATGEYAVIYKTQTLISSTAYTDESGASWIIERYKDGELYWDYFYKNDVMVRKVQVKTFEPTLTPEP